MYETIVQNLAAESFRYDTLEGREHLVVPTVMIREGVWAGSKGPLLYTKEELAKNVTGWDHKPLVVYHPAMQGKAISACDPAVLNTQKVGVILNTRLDGDKLKTESWIDVAKANKVDPRIVPAILARNKTEVSTGLFHGDSQEPGTWNEKAYSGKATDLRPDHLAILPDVAGACGVKDGAGLLANAADPKVVTEYVEALNRSLALMGLTVRPLATNADTGGGNVDKKTKVDTLVKNGRFVEADRDWLMGLPDDKFEKVTKEATPATTPSQNQAVPVPPVLTAQQYIQQAPPEIAAVLNNALASMEQEKAGLVKTITANANNPFTAEFLNTKGLDELRGLARLAGTQPTQNAMFLPNYTGAAGGMPPTANATPPAPLPVPTWDSTDAKK